MNHRRWENWCISSRIDDDVHLVDVQVRARNVVILHDRCASNWWGLIHLLINVVELHHSHILPGGWRSLRAPQIKDHVRQHCCWWIWTSNLSNLPAVFGVMAWTATIVARCCILALWLALVLVHWGLLVPFATAFRCWCPWGSRWRRPLPFKVLILTPFRSFPFDFPFPSFPFTLPLLPCMLDTFHPVNLHRRHTSRVSQGLWWKQSSGVRHRPGSLLWSWLVEGQV